MDPLISILMPTYNRADWLAEALRTAIAQESQGKFDFEVVVIDNNSPDHTRETIERIAADSPVPVKYIHSIPPGDAQTRNAGLPHCEGDWIAFMDDDELAEPTWLLNLYETATRNNAQLVGGAVLLDLPQEEVEKLSLDVRRSLRERSPATCEGIERPFVDREYPGTDNLFIAREVLEALGEFDTTVISGSADYDFSVRAREAGFRCWYSPEAIVRHRTPANRLTQEFIDWDSYRSGVMLAFYDNKFGGKFQVAKWLAARWGQGLLITLPRFFKAKLTGDQQTSDDVRIRWKRLAGFTRSALTLLAPIFFSSHSLQEQIDFARGREIGKSKHKAPKPSQVQPENPPVTEEVTV
ncbi:MAG: glycosyltransferase family A protein [Lacipirellulaceae bacterium]